MALALWDYAERSVYFVFGDDLGDPLADDLLRLLRSCLNGLTRTESTTCLNRHQSSDRIGRALGLLLQHHLGGRPRLLHRADLARRHVAPIRPSQCRVGEGRGRR